MQYLGAISKNDRMISVRFQAKPSNITVIQAYAPITSDKEAEVKWFCDEFQDLLELTPKENNNNNNNNNNKMSFSS